MDLSVRAYGEPLLKLQFKTPLLFFVFCLLRFLSDVSFITLSRFVLSKHVARYEWNKYNLRTHCMAGCKCFFFCFCFFFSKCLNKIQFINGS